MYFTDSEGYVLLSVPSATKLDNPAKKKWFTDDRLKRLKRDGYLIIENVATKEFCSHIVSLIEAFIKAWDPKLDPSTPKEWIANALPMGTIKGIHRIAGQADFEWLVREHPNVVECFAEYFDDATGNMTTSMDAFNYQLAAAIKRDAGEWAHTDHGYYPDGKEPLDGKCLQSFLNLIDCTGPNDGGLVVWAKGHRAWEGYYKAHADDPKVKESIKGNSNWFKYELDKKTGVDHSLFLRDIEVDGRKYLQSSDPSYGSDKPLPMPCIRVKAPAGAMVFWYSKTPHQNAPPFIRDKSSPIGNNRAVVYVCMCPKQYLTPKDKKNKQKAFEQNRQTSHWPAGGQTKIFPATARAYSKELAAHHKERMAQLRENPIYSKTPELTPLGKSLLGY